MLTHIVGLDWKARVSLTVILAFEERYPGVTVARWTEDGLEPYTGPWPTAVRKA